MTDLYNLPEAAAALQWRKSMGMSRVALAKRLGFSPAQIETYEAGVNRSGTPITPAAWLRYRLACAGLATAPEFAWDTAADYIKPKRRPSPQRQPEALRPAA